MEITQGGKSISFSGKQDLYWLENKNWSEIEDARVNVLNLGLRILNLIRKQIQRLREFKSKAIL